MIVVVMRLSKDPERGMKFPNKLDRPDLIQPKIVHCRADSDERSGGEDYGAHGDIRLCFVGAPGSQTLSQLYLRLCRRQRDSRE